MQGKCKKGMERMKTKAVRIHGKMDLRLEEIELPNQEYLADNLKSIQNFAETNTDQGHFRLDLYVDLQGRSRG